MAGVEGEENGRCRGFESASTLEFTMNTFKDSRDFGLMLLE